jgi:hypothetical protein
VETDRVVSAAPFAESAKIASWIGALVASGVSSKRPPAKR